MDCAGACAPTVAQRHWGQSGWSSESWTHNGLIGPKVTNWRRHWCIRHDYDQWFGKGRGARKGKSQAWEYLNNLEMDFWLSWSAERSSTYEYIWALFVNMMRMLWGMPSYGHKFLCDTLSSSRGWWDARICGAAPREAWLRLRCSLICSLSANPKSSIWMHLASCGCLWVVPRILSLQDDLRFQRNAYMYTTGMYDMSLSCLQFRMQTWGIWSGCPHLIEWNGWQKHLGPAVICELSLKFISPGFLQSLRRRQFHHVIVSLWGAGRRTRNLQEAWDWREALVVPGRIDGLKWLSWNIRDACVSFGGMIGKFTDPFSTQSVVERRFQRL